MIIIVRPCFLNPLGICILETLYAVGRFSYVISGILLDFYWETMCLLVRLSHSPP